MKICRVIFSTNRPEFLIPTLESHQKYIDFGDHEVYGIFIDDYPKDRDDKLIVELAKKYGFNEAVLHPENLGLTP
jgi:GT2 family glycosyltransferase